MTVQQRRRPPIASRETLQALLSEGAQALGVALSDAQRGALLDYVALLAKWNAVYNLTAIRDPRQMLIQHILDSLSIVPHLGAHGAAAAALDVGSEAVCRASYSRSRCLAGGSR